MDYNSEGIGVASLNCSRWLNGRSSTFLYVYTSFIVIVDLIIISNQEPTCYILQALLESPLFHPRPVQSHTTWHQFSSTQKYPPLYSSHLQPHVQVLMRSSLAACFTANMLSAKATRSKRLLDEKRFPTTANA